MEPYNNASQMRLYRAIEQALPDSVEKILTKKIVLQDENWDVLAALAEMTKIHPIYNNEKYDIQYQQVYKNRLVILEILLKKGVVNLSGQFGGLSPFNLFIEKGMIEYVELCLKYGFKADYSSLTTIARKPDLNMYELIRKYEPNFEIIDSNSFYHQRPIYYLSQVDNFEKWNKLKTIYTIDDHVIVNDRLMAKIYELVSIRANKQSEPNVKRQAGILLKEMQSQELSSYKTIIELLSIDYGISAIDLVDAINNQNLIIVIYICAVIKENGLIDKILKEYLKDQKMTLEDFLLYEINQARVIRETTNEYKSCIAYCTAYSLLTGIFIG